MMIRSVDTTEEVLLRADFPDENELPTNHLASGSLAGHQTVSEEIDWLLKMRTRNLATRQLSEYTFDMRPSGMATHAAPARITPTRGARFSTGLRRGTLMLALSLLVIGALAGGGYLLASTSWLSGMFPTTTTPEVAAPGPLLPDQRAPGLPAQAQPPQNIPATDERDSHDTQHDINMPLVDPDRPGNQDAESAADASALSGLDARNLRDKGIAAYKAGNYSEAVALLEESISRASDDPVAQYQLGIAYMSVQGRPHSMEDAELAFRTATSLQPKWAAPYQMMAESLMRRGYYEQAVPPALEATQLDPTASDAWLTLGRAYSGAGNDAAATQAFAQATRLGPVPQP